MTDIHEFCFTLYRCLYRIKISPYPFSGSFMPMDTHVGWRGGESFCCSPCYTFPYMLIHWNSFRKICIFPLLLWSFRHWLKFYIISPASAVKMQSEAIMMEYSGTYPPLPSTCRRPSTVYAVILTLPSFTGACTGDWRSLCSTEFLGTSQKKDRGLQ